MSVTAAWVDPSLSALRRGLARDSAAHRRQLLGRGALEAEGFELVAYAPPARAARAPRPVMSEGYEPRVAELDPAAPHSIPDLPGYAAARFSRTVLDELRSGEALIELHRAPLDEAAASATARGNEVLAELVTPRQKQHRRILVMADKNGRRRYLVGGIDGADRLFHLQAYLRLGGVPASSVRRYEPAAAARGALPATLGAQLLARLRSGDVPDQVMIGFVNGMKSEFLARAGLAEWYGRALETLGPSPLGALRELAPGSEPLRALLRQLHPSQLPRTAADVLKWQRSAREVELLAEAVEVASRLPGGERLVALSGPRGAPAIRGVEGDPARARLNELTLRYRDEQGVERRLLILPFPYGDGAAALGRELVRAGVKDVLWFGAAGSVSSGRAVGDLVAPTVVVGRDVVAPLRNHLLERVPASVERRAGVKLERDAAITSVPSLLTETPALLSSLERGGVDLVDVETHHLASAVLSQSGGDAALSVLQVVSDLPASGEPLHVAGVTPAVRERFGGAFDLLRSYYQVDEVLELAGR